MDDKDENSDEMQEQPGLARKRLTTFPYSKKTCGCNCGKYNLHDLPRLRKILPDDYEYKICKYLPLDSEDKFLVTLRMTLATKEEALEWTRHFEEKSLTTHVKDKTFPKVERVSVFKVQYRCQFFDRRKNKPKIPEKSKFRDCHCHSTLFINIKKHFKNTVDRHMPAYCTVIRLHYAHDHPLDTADVLMKRQLNDDIKQRFLELFRQGMKPKDALDKHKRELLQKLGPEKYRQVVCDGYYVPNVPKAYRLYYQVHGKGVSAKTSTKRSSRHNPNPDYIAFQNCPDAVVEGEDGVEDNDADNVDDNGNDEDSAVDDESGSHTVDAIEVAGMEHSHMPADATCDGLLGHQVSQNNLVSDMNVGGAAVSHNLSVPHSLDPKPAGDSVITVHSMMHHDGQMQKLRDTSMGYPNLPVHNSGYGDMRTQNLPHQNMPVTSFGDTHIGMGLFNPTQPSWENFNMAHQQSMVSHIPPQHNLGFQNLGHQNPQASYMILPNTSCQNPNTHYITSQGIVDPNLALQNSVPRTTTDVHMVGPSPGPQYSWTPNRPHQHINAGHAHTNTGDVRRVQAMSTKTASNLNQIARKSAIKRAVQKKRKSCKELNMKNVTKQWMEKKPKVEAETQNLASEVLQTILLTDEAEKLKVKLLTFLSDLESKMTSNPKLFVPAIRNFLRAGENAHDDFELAAFLKDFGKTEENVLHKLQEQKLHKLKHCHVQTRLSGPVVKFSPIRLAQGKARSTENKGMKRSTSSCGLKKSTVGSSEGKSQLISSHPVLASRLSNKQGTNNSSQTASSNLKIEGSTAEHRLKTLSEESSSSSLADGINEQTELCLRSKELKRPSQKSSRVMEERKRFATEEKKKRAKHKTHDRTTSSTIHKILLPEKCRSRSQKVSTHVHKKLVVKLSQVRKTR